MDGIFSFSRCFLQLAGINSPACCRWLQGFLLISILLAANMEPVMTIPYVGWVVVHMKLGI